MGTVSTPATSTIVAETVDLATLRALVADLAAQYPESGARVERAAQLVLFHSVERSDSGAWWVSSLSEEGREYFIFTHDGNRICNCADHQKRGVACMHLLATRLAERLERVEADAGAPIDLELTEAAYTALDALGEVPDLTPQCPRCHAEPAILDHIDHLGPRCLADELFGTDPAA